MLSSTSSPGQLFLSTVHGSGGAGAHLQQARNGVYPGPVTSPSQGNTETPRIHTHSHLRAIERDQLS
ncbi:hypothetical protein ATANTOWER_019604 [Ataeniobius toweri]|uniref:Uncharacterized protein n=1 Tax=Ataeniobius toweri TaxID=208326 RepID=A0ABU7BR66_9TELE|nr:hypothetical protein [Ataeniobius toweri]